MKNLFIAIVAVTMFGASSLAHAADRLNVVLLLADDLGYTGLAGYGSDLHETPNLDRLASQGMKFTNAYSACTVCSPTRVSIMTGKYPARVHLTDFIAGQNRPYAKLAIPDWTKYMRHEEVTIAEALRAAGYATAMVGKWHLDAPRNVASGSFEPVDHGFDVQVLKPDSARGYYLSEPVGDSKSTYLTDYLTDEAVKIIHGNKDRPFFLYFAYHTPHTPIQGREDLVTYYKGKIRSGLRHNNPEYAAMVHSLDMSVGRVLEALESTGVADHTLVIFTSDNGGLTDRFGKPTGFIDNHPLRRGKGSAYEGGTRVPLILRWPDVTQPGSVCDEPVMTIDFYPTILAATASAGDADHNRRVDGVSLVPVLKDASANLERSGLFWHYPHYHAGGDSPYSAVRRGDYKLIHFHEDDQFELYNLAEDVSESDNLASKQPQLVAQLRQMLDTWRRDVGAQMTAPNPNYDPELAARSAAGENVSKNRAAKKQRRKK